MAQLLWVCFGGAVGSGARYLLCAWTQAALGTAFPYGTLAVNVSGSFLMGLAMVVGLDTARLPATVQVALTTGLLGGFTTFSAFSYETVQGLQRGAIGASALYVGATLVGCLGACAFGWLVGRWLVG